MLQFGASKPSITLELIVSDDFQDSRQMQLLMHFAGLTLLLLLLSIAQATSLRFHGNGVNDIDRIKIRRQNLVPPEAMPFTAASGQVYDSGDFGLCLDMALEKSDYANFEARRAEAKARGKLRGIGISCYIEACELSPSKDMDKLGSRVGLYESAQVRVNPDSSVAVFTGSHSHGQGHETTFAQIVCGRLGIPFEKIEIIHGDTARIPFGMGTYGSRSAAVGSNMSARRGRSSRLRPITNWSVATSKAR